MEAEHRMMRVDLVGRMDELCYFVGLLSARIAAFGWRGNVFNCPARQNYFSAIAACHRLRGAELPFIFVFWVLWIAVANVESVATKGKFIAAYRVDDMNYAVVGFGVFQLSVHCVIL
jgi:hypothetical protein